MVNTDWVLLQHAFFFGKKEQTKIASSKLQTQTIQCLSAVYYSLNLSQKIMKNGCYVRIWFVVCFPFSQFFLKNWKQNWPSGIFSLPALHQKNYHFKKKETQRNWSKLTSVENVFFFPFSPGSFLILKNCRKKKKNIKKEEKRNGTVF